MEYYHADRLNYAVAGTPNRLEYDQGFFVKHGDGAADVKPIAHLYKTQVYALAEYLGVPERSAGGRRRPTRSRCRRPRRSSTSRCPTTDGPVPLWPTTTACPPRRSAPAVGLTAEQVERVYRDIDAEAARRRAICTRAALVEPVGRDLTPDVRHRRHRGRCEATPRRRPSASQLRAMAGALRTAGRTSSAFIATRAPGSRTRGCRSSTSPPASSR